MNEVHRRRPRFTGRTAIVTGGSRGLGRHVSMALAAEGATVVIASRKGDACRQVAAEITASTGQVALGMECHVGRWQDCDRLVQAVTSRFGGADVLVNNAGSSPMYSSLAEVPEELFDKVLAVNLKGPFRLSALVGERMVEAGRGSIVNVSSIAAVQPSSHELPYAVAKAGLNCLTMGLARAFAPAVRVNAVMAGPFDTDIASAWSPRRRAALEAATPIGRLGTPGEIVGAVLHLASDESSYTTGAVLKVDGGLAWAPG